MSISDNSTLKMNEMTQLAKTFTTACKKIVEEGKVKTYEPDMALVVTAASSILIVPANHAILDWWP